MKYDICAYLGVKVMSGYLFLSPSCVFLWKLMKCVRSLSCEPRRSAFSPFVHCSNYITRCYIYIMYRGRVRCASEMIRFASGSNT